MKYISYIFVFLLIGCGTKKKVFTSVSKVTDSVIVRVENVERPPVLSSLTIDEICDSTTNTPVKFKKIFVVEKDTIEISTIDNQLRFKFQAQSQLIKQFRDSIQIRDSQLRESSEKVKYRLDIKWIIGCLVIGFIVGWLRPWRLIS